MSCALGSDDLSLSPSLDVNFEANEIADDATDQDIINYLYNIEFFRTNDLEKFRIEDIGDGWIEIYQAEDDKPLCRLQKNQ